MSERVPEIKDITIQYDPTYSAIEDIAILPIFDVPSKTVLLKVKEHTPLSEEKIVYEGCASWSKIRCNGCNKTNCPARGVAPLWFSDQDKISGRSPALLPSNWWKTENI